ncbi:MAG: hypothetical protein ACOY90_20140 [Candidatus Zhuqueibacterota bacterium]
MFRWNYPVTRWVKPCNCFYLLLLKELMAECCLPIAEIAFKACVAAENGASAEYVRDLALIGKPAVIASDQLEMAAKGIENK